MATKAKGRHLTGHSGTRKKVDDERTQREDVYEDKCKVIKPVFLKLNDMNEDDNGKDAKEKEDGNIGKENEELSFGDKKDNRVRWCLKTMNMTSREIIKDYIKNKTVKPDNYTYEFFKNNEEKNRYADIMCVDNTRVVLKDREDNKDYIHASWITLPSGYKYICTQGPLMETIEDFWHMVATEKSLVIVMLCSLIEAGMSKCDRYFPKPGTVITTGSFKIKYVSQEKDLADGITVHTYDLIYKENIQKITHYQCTIWNDHLAPIDAGPIVRLLREARSVAKSSPITVHCSAGIGRSSTFVGIELASQKIKKDDKYSLVDLLKELRGMRFHAIQGPIQYLFMNVAIIEYFAQEDVIRRKSHYEKFNKEYRRAIEKYERKVHKVEESRKNQKKKKD